MKMASKAKDRFEIAKKIIDTEKNLVLVEENIIIKNFLVLTVSAQQKDVIETIKAVKMVKELGVHTVLGVSNVSFGLPNRPLLNKTFLTMAMTNGLNSYQSSNPLDQEFNNHMMLLMFYLIMIVMLLIISKNSQIKLLLINLNHLILA